MGRTFGRHCYYHVQCYCDTGCSATNGYYFSPYPPEEFSNMHYVESVVGYSLRTIQNYVNFYTIPRQKGYVISMHPYFQEPKLLIIWEDLQENNYSYEYILGDLNLAAPLDDYCIYSSDNDILPLRVLNMDVSNNGQKTPIEKVKYLIACLRSTYGSTGVVERKQVLDERLRITADTILKVR